MGLLPWLVPGPGLMGVAAAALFALAVAQLLRSVARRRLSRRATVDRERLEKSYASAPVDDLAAVAKGSDVVLHGTLVTDGSASRLDGADPPVAATTVEASRRRLWVEPGPALVVGSTRAPGLTLRTAAADIVLADPVRAVVGSDTWFSGRTLESLRARPRPRAPDVRSMLAARAPRGPGQRSPRISRLYAVVRRLGDGDEVIAVGKLWRVDDLPHASPYRDAPGRYVLQHPDGSHEIALGALGRLGLSSAHRALLPPWAWGAAAVLLLATTWAGGMVHRQQFVCAARCPGNGHCSVGLGLTDNRELLSCRPRSDEHCRQSAGCTVLGRCVLHDGQCIVAFHEDCRRSRQCAEAGACQAVLDLFGVSACRQQRGPGGNFRE